MSTGSGAGTCGMTRAMIKIDCDIAKEGQLQLLVDTVAVISLVKVRCPKGDTKMKINESIRINGLFGQEKATLGTVEATFL